MMIDPKVVELQIYNGLPHLAAPVVHDPKKVILALKWVVNEMEKRYQIFAEVVPGTPEVRKQVSKIFSTVTAS